MPPLPADAIAVNLTGEALGRGTPMAQLVATLRGTVLNATHAALEARGSKADAPGAVVVNVWGPFILFSLNTAGCVSPRGDTPSRKAARVVPCNCHPAAQ